MMIDTELSQAEKLSPVHIIGGKVIDSGGVSFGSDGWDLLSNVTTTPVAKPSAPTEEDKQHYGTNYLGHNGAFPR